MRIFGSTMQFSPVFRRLLLNRVHSYSSEDLFPPAQVRVIQAFREYGWHVTEGHTKLLGRDLANWAVASHLVSHSTMSSWSFHGQVCDLSLFFVYTTTHKRFVIFTCRYFKLTWNTTALSQSDCRNFSCSSIRLIITSWHGKTAPRNAFPLEKCPKIRISENQENYS